ncbi:hypothetical protein JA9_003200 [Meyerozyma sp. JA9]|nr:hypothetical protein JA9_003200 [Meyerozyma sp. JA9]
MRHVFLLFLLAVSEAAFIQSQSCSFNTDQFVFAPALVDVALDEQHDLLKFFVNTQVQDSSAGDSVVINDVNSTTNLYTTLHVQITYQGKVIVNENKRFCDLLMVKRPPQFYTSPRFDKPASSSTHSTFHAFPTGLIHNVTGGILSQRNDRSVLSSRDDDSDRYRSKHKYPCLSDSNSTISSLFSNTTGTLVQCPLYNNDSLALYYQVDVSKYMRSIGSYSARFTVVSNDNKGTVLGCSQLYVTPVISESIINSIMFAVLALFIVTGVINIFTVIYSSYQESSNPFLFMASTICNRGLLRQLGATVQQITVYFQFAFFIGALDLQYPGFYQPMISSIRWCSLLGFNFIGSSSTAKQHRDNVYFTLNVGGLQTLTSYTSAHSSTIAWPNFMITLAVWFVLLILIQQAFLVLNYCMEWLRPKSRWIQIMTGWKRFIAFSDFDTKRDIAFILGQLVSHFMLLFGFPFLVLTSYVMVEAGNLNGRHKFSFVFSEVRQAAYSDTSTYQQLWAPLSELAQDHKKPSVGSNSTSTLNTTRELASTISPLRNSTLDTTTLNSTLNANLPQTRETVTSSFPTYRSVSTPIIALAVIFFAIWVGLAFYLIFGYLVRISQYKITQNDRVKKLYTSVKTILIWSPFYHSYHPNKVYFVIIDLLTVMFRSLIVGCLQTNGAYQVGALIVLEVAYSILHFGIWPFFVDLCWWNTKTIIPPARLLVTLLCIPFIKELNYAEDMRSRIAFAHFAVHMFVVVVFLVQLVHGIVITIRSIVKSERSSDPGGNNLKKHTSYDSFAAAFDYQHVSQEKKMPTEDEDVNSSPGNDSASDVLYYRSGAIEARRDDSNSIASSRSITFKGTPEEAGSVTVADDTVDEASSYTPKRNDYTFREADLIYRKYFTGDSVDPDIKAMWDARQIWDTQESRNEKEFMEKMPSPQTHSGPATRLCNLFGKKQPVERSFHVSRPRKLVVKKLEDDGSSSLTSDSTPTK